MKPISLLLNHKIDMQCRSALGLLYLSCGLILQDNKLNLNPLVVYQADKLAESNKFEKEIRQEQEEKRKELEEKKKRQAAFKEKANLFK